jgi:hypothetical protein
MLGIGPINHCKDNIFPLLRLIASSSKFSEIIGYINP